MGSVMSYFRSPSSATSPADRPTDGLPIEVEEVLFKNALLVDKEGTFDVLISSSSIKSITSTSSSLPSPSPSTASPTKTIDLQSRYYISPSLVDHHVHFSAWTLNRSRLDLSGCKSAREVVELVKKRAAEEGSEMKEPLIARDFRVGEWPDIDSMTKETLDDAVPSRPVALISGDLHSLWLGTSALTHLGIDASTTKGVLFEKEAFNALNKLNDISADTLDELVRETAKEAASKGVTEIVELEMTHNMKSWTRRVREKGIRSLRVRLGMYEEHVEDAISIGLKSGDEVPGGEGLLTVGPYKIITDGSLGARTAFCCDPYPGTSDHGLFIYPQKTLESMLAHGTAHQLVLAVHAIGDAANAKTFTALASLSPPPLPGSSIEHAQLLSFQDIPKFKELDLIASIQPEHLNDDKGLADRFWAGRTDRAFAYKSMVDAGVRIKLGSDAPVAPLDPWGSMAAAVARERSGEEGRGSWHPEQRLSNREAFEGSTWSGKAFVEEGKKVDLIVVAKDPLTCDAKELRRMQVLGTMLGGRWTYKSVELDTLS